MSFYNGNSQQSCGSNSGGSEHYTPYMMGPCRAPVSMMGGSSGDVRARNQYESVRECMYWPTSLGTNAQQQQRAEFAQMQYPVSFQTRKEINYSANQYQPRQSGYVPANYPQPKAFMQMPGQGGGEQIMGPMSIPCQSGPLGTNPAHLMQPVKPLTIKVVAPPGGNPGGVCSPMSFQFSPQDLQR